MTEEEDGVGWFALDTDDAVKNQGQWPSCGGGDIRDSQGFMHYAVSENKNNTVRVSAAC